MKSTLSYANRNINNGSKHCELETGAKNLENVTSVAKKGQAEQCSLLLHQGKAPSCMYLTSKLTQASWLFLISYNWNFDPKEKKHKHSHPLS